MPLDLNIYKKPIPIILKQYPDVVFSCNRPLLDDYKLISSVVDQAKQIFENCVMEWEGLELDGKSFECTKANKSKLYELNAALFINVANELVKTTTDEVETELGN